MYKRVFEALFLKLWRNEIEYYKTNNINKARMLAIVAYLPVVICHPYLYIEFIDRAFHSFYEEYIHSIFAIKNFAIYYLLIYFILINIIFTKSYAKKLADSFMEKKINEEPFWLYAAFVFVPLIFSIIYIIMFARKAIYL
ncbi:hypothetical protein [Leptospira alexanderi]|uniref:hypothetical protein n=1 Tax=Leptospira alexanderi TaxID=100053 RepID=UPI00099141B6|nr:hypothetical protein [Leptospira alexanderi]